MKEPDRRPATRGHPDALARGLANVDARLQGLVAATPVVIFVVDRTGRLMHWAGSGIGRVGPEQLQLRAVRAAVASALAGNVAVDVMDADGVVFALTVVPGTGGGAIGAAYELGALRDASHRLARDAFIDRLTGLATRPTSSTVWRRRALGPRSRRSRSLCSSWTSTASPSSTTHWATPRATGCWRRSRPASPRSNATAT